MSGDLPFGTYEASDHQAVFTAPSGSSRKLGPMWSNSSAEEPRRVDALQRYATSVRARKFPSDEHYYTIEDEELRRFLAAVHADG
jgi:ketopantoate hydroxymethyltransferase